MVFIKLKLEKLVQGALKKAFPELGKQEITIEYPQEKEHGDYACNVGLQLASKLKKNPREIARKVVEKLRGKGAEFFEKVEIAGPGFINFHLSPKFLGQRLKHLEKLGPAFFFNSSGRGKKILIEYSAPNTNKPLHLGHVRNQAIGMALSNILEASGSKIIRVNLITDRGVHICKSMLAYQLYGQGKTPNSTGKKGDHFVGDYYVLYEKKAQENPDFEEKIHELLRKWEEGDPSILNLWKKMNAWVLQGFNQTYRALGCQFDKVYFESKTYLLGRKYVLQGLKKGLFQKEKNGAISADLAPYGLDKKILLRSDGTSVYITQDLGTTELKYRDFKPQKMIWVVANEQNYHFQVLFALLKMLGRPWVKNCYHLSYGLVHLPEGRMKSREGTVVDADDLLAEMKKEAWEEIKKRKIITRGETMDKTAEIIALGALKFFILKIDPAKDMVFDPQKSISFEGDTGPYLQYTHARICSILRKAKKLPVKFEPSLLKEKEEIALLKKLNLLPEIIDQAGTEYHPHDLAVALHELGQDFNTFYTRHPVLRAEPKLRTARLHLIKAVALAIKTGLKLLGIESPEKM